MKLKSFFDIALEGERIFSLLNEDTEGNCFKLNKIVLDYKKVDPGFCIDFYSSDLELILSFSLSETVNKSELEAIKVFYPRSIACSNSNLMFTFDGENSIPVKFVSCGFIKAVIKGLGKGKINALKLFFE